MNLITIIKNTRKRNKGFTLIELMLVLGISSLAFIGFVQMEQKRQEILAAENSGNQLYEVGQALAQYITMNNSTLQTAIPLNTTTAAIPLSVMQSSTGTTNIGGVPVNNKLLLPTTYINRLGFPTVSPVTYSIYLRNNAGTIVGLIITDAGIVDKTGAIRYDWAGTAMKKAGSNTGVTFGLSNQLNGLNGVWTLTSSDFPAINALGKLGYRVAYQGSYDNTYLRLDGMYPMIGNLNMGNYNIKNATDISYTGWLYGNNGVMNNLLTGTITNAGNITTQSINGKKTVLGAANAATYANNVNSNYSYANFDLLYSNCINCGGPYESGTVSSKYNPANGDVKIGNSGNAGTLFVKDVILGAGGAIQTPKNSYLSDRLPRYVDRGIILISDGQTLAKPAVTTSNQTGYVCRWTGEGHAPVPKIELIPAFQWVQGAVLGTLNLNFNGSGLDSTTLLYLNGGIYQDQFSLGAFTVYATDNGSSWTVHARTPPYNVTNAGGTVLAHIYCDYGN
jgi:prepilin-type N-terminal cleavage/methylation domain-containing protein